MRGFLSLIAVLNLLFSLVIPKAIQAEAAFSDVSDSHRFYNEMMFLESKGIISGYPDGTFRPGETVNRAQLAIMLGRTLNLDGTKRPTKFSDVDPKSVASGYIASAVESGFVSGYPDGTYRPNEKVNRAQMAIFLSRAFNLIEEANVSFPDVYEGQVAYKHVKRILAARITAGFEDGSYRPEYTVSRAAFSAFLARALDDTFKPDKELKAHFIDVGQGDSSLIVTPNGKTILIDGGPRSAGEKVVSYLKASGVSSIDLVVGTHPDADHIGGLIAVLEEIDVKRVIDSGKSHTSQTYYDYLKVIDRKNIQFDIAQEGSTIYLDNEIDIKVLNSSTESEDNNESSVVLKISYGQIDYLYTGDAEIKQEHEMMAKYNIEAEVLKVGHHGSNTSTSSEFVDAVKPEVSVLSYEVGNSYGHPYNEVVDRLKAAGSDIYSTAKSGNFVVKTNGTFYTVSANIWQEGTDENLPTQPSPNSVEITNINLDSEVVTIKNSGSTDVDMTGWKLVSVEGNQVYEFPSGYILKGDAIVYVTSGTNAVDNPPTYLKWTGAYIWNNAGDSAELYNSEGVKVSDFR